MSGSFRFSSPGRIEFVKWYAIYQNAPRSVSTDENRERVRVAFQESSETPARRAALELNLS